MWSGLNCATYDYSLYTWPAQLWAWLMILAYMTLLVICACLQLYAGGGNSNLLSFHPFLFTKDALSAKALTLSTAGMTDVFRHFGVHMHIFLDSRSDTQWFKISYLWLWYLMITILPSTTLLHNNLLHWDGPISLVLTIWLSNVGYIPLPFILTLLIHQGHISIVTLRFWRV